MSNPFLGEKACFSWGALALFLFVAATTVCLGHSLGMHRRLVHRSYCGSSL
jgi:fatty-acid desaturase